MSDAPTKLCADSIIEESALNLSDLSERDKPWDKHRSNADRIEGYYFGSEFQRYAERIDQCSQFLDFLLVPDTCSAYRLKLESARFCRVRHCPVCQWRRSLMWKAKAYKILPLVVQDHPRSRWLFLTLTVKNCSVTDLRSTIQWMNESFKRMTKRKAFPAIGFIKSVEVTRNRWGDAHPHFHTLLMVPAGYFSGQEYLSQKKWCELWKSSLRVNYTPILDVQAVKQDKHPSSLIPELLKYTTKESDLIADRDWFLELTRQMHKLRCIAVGGVLKDYLKALEEEPGDLIGKGEEEKEEVDEGHLYFGWKRRVKRYKLIGD